jgi:hypothetical protein
MLHASAMVDLLTADEKAPDIRHRLGAWCPKSLSRSSAAQDTDRCDRFPVGSGRCAARFGQAVGQSAVETTPSRRQSHSPDAGSFRLPIAAIDRQCAPDR